jgi:hypothetical protein
VHACVCVCVHVCVCTYARTRVGTMGNTDLQCAPMRAHAQTRTHARTQARAHTHAQTCGGQWDEHTRYVCSTFVQSKRTTYAERMLNVCLFTFVHLFVFLAVSWAYLIYRMCSLTKECVLLLCKGAHGGEFSILHQRRSYEGHWGIRGMIYSMH